MDDKILVGRIGSIVGVVTTGLGAILKFRNDTRFEYDKDLRAKRIDEYSKLWTLTGRFPGMLAKIQGAESEMGLRPTYYQHLRKVGSALRTTLVRDVGTRHDAG